MLILTRRPGETVQVGPDVFVTVRQITAGQVVLGFDAPRDTKIMRTEVLERDNHKQESKA